MLGAEGGAEQIVIGVAAAQAVHVRARAVLRRRRCHCRHHEALALNNCVGRHLVSCIADTSGGCTHAQLQAQVPCCGSTDGS